MLFLGSLKVVQDFLHSTSFSSASLQLFNVKQGMRVSLIRGWKWCTILSTHRLATSCFFLLSQAHGLSACPSLTGFGSMSASEDCNRSMNEFTALHETKSAHVCMYAFVPPHASKEAELQPSAAEKTTTGKNRMFCTVHAIVHAQCTPQCAATKRCKYHGISDLSGKSQKNTLFFSF